MTAREGIPVRITMANAIALILALLTIGGIVVQLGRLVQKVEDIGAQVIYLRERIDGIRPPPTASKSAFRAGENTVCLDQPAHRPTARITRQ